MDYVNPESGGPVMQTLGASMQMLRPGEHTLAHREVGSFVYQCAKGSGFSVVNGKRLDWKERDIFCVPSWMWHEHANGSDTEDACLFCFHDLPVMKALRSEEQQSELQSIMRITYAVFCLTKKKIT